MAFEAIGWFYLVVNVVFVLVVKAAADVFPSYLRPLFLLPVKHALSRLSGFSGMCNSLILYRIWSRKLVSPSCLAMVTTLLYSDLVIPLEISG